MSRHSRTSMRATDEDLNFEPPTKCHCQHCQMRHPTQQMIDERERLDNNEPDVLRAIDDQVDDLIQDLAKMVKFKSVSVEPKFLVESCMALDWIANRLAHLKFRIYEHQIPDDPANCFREPHQKVLFARYFSSPTKPTLLIYGHLDVLPAKPECWLNDPFEMILKDGLVYGRGVTSGKGMLVGWIHAIECWLQVHEDLPINVKFIVDMLHEVGSTGLQDYVRARSDFFVDIDYMVFDVNSWLNNDRPVISCSLTGWAYFGVELRGANKSLEGGLAGGLVFEPMIDMCHVMNRLVNDEHEIEIPRIENNVRRLSTPEWHLLETADFSSYEYREELFVRRLRHDANKVELLQKRWCKPSLTMHGIEGADSRPGCSRILPMKVLGKFSIRLVPDQEVDQVHIAVKEYLLHLSNELALGTTISVHLIDYMEPTSWSMESKLMKALMRAVGEVYQKDPIATQGIPICLPIANVLGKLIRKPIILMPFYKRRDRHHQENESIEEDNLMRHTKTCARLLYELSFLRTKCKCDLINKYCNLRGVKEKLDADRGYDLPVPPKRNLLTSFFKLKHKDQPAPKKAPKRKSLKKFLCLPFSFKKPNKRKRAPAAPI
ncbi:cytosolic non-specific dipeptidase-like [Drosophila montana]|uniref:cytosolic non-specific dipeptidase-like n=1 Tax=Drosophila montana TaxID=40370 RepID=UPI00313F0278